MADYSKPVNVALTFTDQSSENPISFEWDFGDGTPIVITMQKAVVHTYTMTGTFTIAHTVINACGAKSCTKTIDITVPTPVGKYLAIATAGGLLLAALGLMLTRKKEKTPEELALERGMSFRRG